MVILNAAPAQPIPPQVLPLVDLLVVNQHEAAALTGAASPQDAIPRLLQDVPAVVVTLGADGCVYATPTDTAWVPAPQVTVVDTTGAGDTFCGVLAARLAGGDPIDDALTLASAAAALSVGRHHAQPSIPTRDAAETLRRQTYPTPIPR